MKDNLTYNPIRNISSNPIGKDYIVGDIHGNFSKLVHKLQEINFYFNKDRLFSVGDILDRGKENTQCFDLIFEPWFFAVRGNHEQMLIDTLDQNYIDSYLAYGNGAGWFVELETPLSEDQSYSKEFVARNLKVLPYVIQLESPSGVIGIVHASPLCYDWKIFLKGIETNPQALENCLWDREFYNNVDAAGNINKSIKGIDYVVTGHNHSPAPLVVNNFYSIATCWYDKDKEWDFVLVDTSNMSLV